MRKQIAVYSVLLGLALIAAYMSWTASPDTSKEEAVVLLDVAAEEIESVHYVSADLDVMLTAREDWRGRFFWGKLIKEERSPRPERPDPPDPPSPPEPDHGESDAGETGAESTGVGEDPEGPDDGDTGTDAEGGTEADTDAPDEKATEPVEPTEVEPETETIVMEFVVGAAGDKLLESLAPFTARRALEGVTDDKLEEYGLADASATLTLQIRGRDPVTYEIGESAFGAGVSYVREPNGGQVYVVDANALRPLAKADKRLPNRTLFAGKTKDLVRIEVVAGDERIALEHRNREDPEREFWSVEGIESGDETAKAWLQKFFRLRASGYVPEDEVPSPLEPRFSVICVDAEGLETTVEILTGATAKGDPGWYGRSEHTRGLVELNPSLAEEAAQDVSALLE